MGPLSPQLFAILSALVEERIGLHYGPEDARVFSDKVSARMQDAGFDSALDYYYLLRYDDPAGAEMDALTDALVVGETYLFRELEALRVALDLVIRPAIERHGHARVWSAGCATGEEPVTLAMLAKDAGLLDRLEIIATDLSPRALARARAGVYGARSLRAVDGATEPVVREAAGRWLTRNASGGAQVSRTILGAVDFRRLNLLDDAAVSALGHFDLVLCRNVLIYFRDELVQAVVATLTSALSPDGRLAVGASESLLRFGTALHCEERRGAFFYARER